MKKKILMLPLVLAMVCCATSATFAQESMQDTVASEESSESVVAIPDESVPSHRDGECNDTYVILPDEYYVSVPIYFDGKFAGTAQRLPPPIAE